MKVSRHGGERVRERLGLPRRAVAREAERAYREGRRHGDFSGSFRRYLDDVYLREGSATRMRVHGTHLFLFSSDGTLITAWLLPRRFRNRRGIVGGTDREA